MDGGGTGRDMWRDAPGVNLFMRSRKNSGGSGTR